MRMWLVGMALTLWAGAAAAQNVGAGPLSASLLDTEPTSGVIDVGPLKVAPGIVIPQIGANSNIYDEPEDPKSDFITQVAPDLSVFSRMRFVKLSVYTGGDFAWFQEYKTENWTGYRVRGRVDLLLSRVRPFAAYGQTRTREQANGEIDTRANRIETERSGGVAFETGRFSNVYASAVLMSTEFRDALNQGVDLGQSLSRDAEDYAGGFQTALTPLTTLTFRAGYRRDLFRDAPDRDAETVYGNGTFAFAPQAVLNGSMTVGYTDFQAADPAVRPYRGITVSGAVTAPVAEAGRLNLGLVRGIEYSFDETEAYYVELTWTLSYTQRLGGAFDLQGRGSRSRFDYGNREGSPERQDQLDTWGAGLGYNLKNRTRIAMNYEVARRRSPDLPDRNYDRRRVYLSWTFAY